MVMSSFSRAAVSLETHKLDALSMLIVSSVHSAKSSLSYFFFLSCLSIEINSAAMSLRSDLLSAFKAKELNRTLSKSVASRDDLVRRENKAVLFSIIWNTFRSVSWQKRGHDYNVTRRCVH